MSKASTTERDNLKSMASERCEEIEHLEKQIDDLQQQIVGILFFLIGALGLFLTILIMILIR